MIINSNYKRVKIYKIYIKKKRRENNNESITIIKFVSILSLINQIQ